MGEQVGNLRVQYTQDIDNLLFIVKNILQTYENSENENKDISMYMPQLKEYYDNVLQSQQELKDFKRTIETHTYK